MNTFRIKEYQQQVDVFNSLLKKTRKKHATLSVFRLIVFLALLLTWFYLITLNLSVGITIGSALIGLFLALIKQHKNLEDKIEYLKTIIEVNQHEIRCCKNDFSVFEPGNEFIDPEHPYSYDVDLFGKGSLFQYINRTVTFKGREILAKWLLNTPLTKNKIIQNQGAVNDLKNKTSFRQQFIALGRIYKAGPEHHQAIKNWLNLPSFFKQKTLWKVLLWILPFINIAILSGVIFKIINFQVLVLVLIASLIFVGTKIKRFNLIYNQLNKSHASLKQLCHLFELIEKTPVNAQTLEQEKQKLFNHKLPASQQVKKLTKLLDGLDNRNNLLLGFILNGLLFWDWQYLWRIEKWQRSHHLDYENWQNTLAYYDAIISLANMAYNNPDYCFPEISQLEYEFTAYNIGHPLLPKDTRICNDFTLNKTQRYGIITGANMAGKSTFLRTVATNIILAGAGSVVCAKKLVFTPLPLYSSMRTEDSLMKNESYFFAELKRLQKITTALDKGHRLFIILDEILRGTNSEDKRKGSIGFVQKITQKQAHGLVATHDLELARLAEQQPDIFKAECFEVEIKNNELNFDYKLTPGVTKNMNASFLMEKMGIIDK